MNEESFPGDRPGGRDRDEEKHNPEGSPQEGGEASMGFEPSLEGFQPTDLSRLFDMGVQQEPSTDSAPAEPNWMAERNAERENITPKKLYEKEVKVVAVYEQQTAYNGARAFFVQLRDNAGRELKVYVGLPEATSISMATENIKFRRPLTHDLTKLIIERVGWKIDRVTIDDLYNETFYAKLTLTKGQELIDIDCRPSDAIALALRGTVPIYVAEDVLAAASRDEPSLEEGDPGE